MAQSIIAETGNSYGTLTVSHLVGVASFGAVWAARCLCGRTREATGHALRSRRVRSCGAPACRRRLRETAPLDGALEAAAARPYIADPARDPMTARRRP
jgi:hypothetical protein